MKINEMIEKLKAIESEIGDCDVWLSSNCGHFAYTPKISINTVSKSKDKKFVSKRGVKCACIS